MVQSSTFAYLFLQTKTHVLHALHEVIRGITANSIGIRTFDSSYASADRKCIKFPFISERYIVIVSKAFVFLNCDVGTEKGIIVQMKNIFGVSHASGVSGIYDIVAELDSDSQKGIAGIVRQFRSIGSIRSCLTMIVAEKRMESVNGMITN